MQTSGSLTCRRQSSTGFTLIEILVVLLLITILTGVAVTQLPAIAQNSDFDTEARRLELLLNMAKNEALLESMEYGFGPTRDGYEFLRYDDMSQEWQQLDAPFNPRKLPEDIRLTVRAESSDYGLEGENVPPVLLLSSGETTPVTMTLRSRRGSLERILESDGYSAFSWQNQDVAPR